MTNRLIFATCFIFISAITGCGVPLENVSTLGTHTLTIIDTSANKPLGGTSETHHDATATTTHIFESANGRYKIKLENEVITINGAKYTLENPTDSIRIVENQVEINGVETVPDTE